MDAAQGRQWSEQQEAIFGWFMSGEGNLVVRARAGTGKTTTIIQAVQDAPEGAILLCAFNKRIADELQARLRKAGDPRIEASTLHSAGFQSIKAQWPGCRVDSQRGRALALRACGAQAPDEMVALVAKLAGCGKNMAPFADALALEPIAVKMDCAPDEGWEDDGWSIAKVAGLARRAMDLALERDGTVDFDDMLYVAVANKFARPAYDLVVVDEAQDMCFTQLLLAQRLRAKGGRIVVVGDDRQAIYGFRGADSEALDRLKAELGAAEMGLTITYRCPQKVVAQAKRLVPDFCASPTAPEGSVSSVARERMMVDAKPGDAILSRKNAPLVSICLRLLREGKRARMEGRDIGQGLISLVRKLRAKSMPDFVARMARWRDREMKKIQGNDQSAIERREGVMDKAETLTALAEGCAGLKELEARIESLFVDSPVGGTEDKIVCSSVHKAKGLEWPRVYGLRKTLYPRKTRDIEECNIEYVLITRAMDSLIWIED